jgi:cytochrome c oxidase subunit 4
MSQHTASTPHSTSHYPHIIPLKVYLGIGTLLLLLTGVTVVTASFDFGHLLGIPHLNIVIAMIIATFKASLVAMFFMHLYWDNKLYLAAFLIGILCLGIFIALTMFDTMRRGDTYEIEGGTIRQQSEMYKDRPVTAPNAEPSHSGH